MGARQAAYARLPGGAQRPALPDREHGDAALTIFADIIRIGLAVCAGAFLAAGHDSDALKALLVLAAALPGRLARVEPAFDLLFTLALAAELIGTGLGALDWIGWGDEESHLVIPFLSAPIVYKVLVRLSATPPLDLARVPHPFVGAFVLTGVGVLALGALWELVEWGADRSFGTDYSEGYTDTLSDLLADAVAAAAGGVLVAVWLRLTASDSAPHRVAPLHTYGQQERA
jgi:hypothetical protein